MRILADENVPLAAIIRLRAVGHDVEAASDAFPSADDAVVLRRAREERRILITFDRDFGELVIRDRLPPPPGIVYIRVRPASPDEAAEVILAVTEHGTISLEGYLTVVGRDRVRQRALPRPR